VFCCSVDWQGWSCRRAARRSRGRVCRAQSAHIQHGLVASSALAQLCDALTSIRPSRREQQPQQWRCSSVIVRLVTPGVERAVGGGVWRQPIEGSGVLSAGAGGGMASDDASIGTCQSPHHTVPSHHTPHQVRGGHGRRPSAVARMIWGPCATNQTCLTVCGRALRQVPLHRVSERSQNPLHALPRPLCKPEGLYPSGFAFGPRPTPTTPTCCSLFRPTRQPFRRHQGQWAAMVVRACIKPPATALFSLLRGLLRCSTAAGCGTAAPGAHCMPRPRVAVLPCCHHCVCCCAAE
jgi:hypothetical protein